MRTRKQPPYWLGEGSEICESCEHGFVRESGFHCSACDAAICGECVLVDPITGALLCVTCRESGLEGE